MDKITFRLGSLGTDFQLIEPKAMDKITGGSALTSPTSVINTCGGIMPS